MLIINVKLALRDLFRMTGFVLQKIAAKFMLMRNVKLSFKDLSGITVDEWNKERTSIVYNSYYQWVTI